MRKDYYDDDNTTFMTTPNHTPVAISFSELEKAVIKEYTKKTGIGASQLVRLALLHYIETHPVKGFEEIFRGMGGGSTD